MYTLVRLLITTTMALTIVALPMHSITAQTPEPFTCPVTFPNTSELMGLPKYPGDGMVYNEDDLWIAIPADGILEFDPELHGSVDNPEFEDWLGFKLHVHRGADAKGNVTITGERLDALSDLEPMNILGVEDSYRDMGFLPVSLMIP